MNDRDAFLRAIRANPDDDTVRLVFADWLNEHGEEELAEFIRVQIELEPIRYRIDNPRAVELHRRETELLGEHRRDWVGMEGLSEPPNFGPVFRRGFPHHISASFDAFSDTGDELLTACPTVREVTLFGVANRFDDDRLAHLFADLDTLEIADWPTRTDARVLAPQLERVPCFKLWAGPNPWLLHELVRNRTAHWPHDIELVQVSGGVSCANMIEALERDEETTRLAREANERFGREVVRVARPFEQQFPLDGEVGPNLRAGYLPDGCAALAACSFTDWVLVVFDDAGRVEYVDRHDSPYSGPRDPHRLSDTNRALRAAFDRWTNESLRLQPATIWVREFDADGLRLALWPSALAERVGNLSSFAPNDEDEYTSLGEFLGVWRDRGGDARKWLERRNFLIQWGRDHWADWRGRIFTP